MRTAAVENTHKLLVLFASLKKLEEFWELILLPNKFIAELTEKLLVLCSESDESIRILVAEVFQMIVKQFLSEEDSILDTDLSEELKKKKRDFASMSSNAQFQQRLIELADQESEKVKHVFSESEAMVSGLVKLLVDET